MKDQQSNKSTLFFSILPAAFVAIFLLAWLVIYRLYGKSIVPLALYPPFADLITITGSVDCLRAGLDPYVYSGFDPWGRLYNYPKIWLTIFNFLGIDRSATNVVGILYILLFYITTLPLLGRFMKRPRMDRIFLLLLFILSPLVLLLLERGNSDILIYVLVLVSVYYVRRLSFIRQDIRICLAYGLIVLAGILKIYPVFLLLLLFFEKISVRQRLIILSFSLVILCAYFSFTFDDLLFISRNTPKDETISYGKNVLLQNYFSGRLLILISNGLLLSVFFAAWYVSSKYSKSLNHLLETETGSGSSALLLFTAGGLIYAGTFFIGNNYDYRLVFLLLTLPLLLRLFDGNKKIISTVLGLFLLAYYGGFFLRLDILERLHLLGLFRTLDQLLDWAVFFLISLMIIRLYKINREIIHTQ